MKLKLNNTYWFLAISIVALLLAIYFFADIVIYVIIAFIMSLIGQPLMRFFLNKLHFKKWKFGLALSAILTIIIFLSGFFTFIYIFVPLIITQTSHLVDLDYGVIGDALDTPIQQMRDYFSKFGVDITNKSSEEITREAFKDWFNPNIINEFVTGIISLATNFIMGIFSVTFISFFFLQENKIVENFIIALVPTQHETSVRAVLRDTIKLLTRYFTGVIFQIIIITTFVTGALSIFGIENAFLIGFFAAIINVIPYIGPMIGAAFGVIVTLSSTVGVDFYGLVVPMLLTVVAVFACMQLLDNFILQPYIFSNSVLAHPLEIFLVILIAAKLGGITGMVLAIPVYTMIRVVARNFLHNFKIVQQLTKGLDEVVKDEI